MLQNKMIALVVLSILALGSYGYSVDQEKGAMLGIFLSLSFLYVLVMLQLKYKFPQLHWMFKIEGEKEKST